MSMSRGDGGLPDWFLPAYFVIMIVEALGGAIWFAVNGYWDGATIYGSLAVVLTLFGWWLWYISHE